MNLLLISVPHILHIGPETSRMYTAQITSRN